MNRLRHFFVYAVVLARVIPGVRAAEVAGPDLSPQERRAAKALYEIKCAKCHKFYEPAAYAQKDWDDWMSQMSRKSKLKPAQEKLLTQFLDEFRQKPAPAGAK